MANLDDYREVPDRLIEFFEKFPEGSMTGSFSITVMPDKNGQDKPHVIYTAYANRHELDAKPGVGTASEPIPGFTQFTKGSEVMNAETSAWGRALVAVGIVSKKIASAQEVRNRQEDKPAKPAAPKTLTEAQATRLADKLGSINVSLDASMIWLQSQGVESVAALNTSQAKAMVEHFESRVAA